MMLGKTGIFDHNPQGAGQTARIFYTQVVEDPSRETSCGEPFCQLPGPVLPAPLREKHRPDFGD